MDWNVFDFDHDGQIEPYEVGIGASLIGSAGYGAGLSEADSKARRLREEYEEELKRKQDRIDELEDELEELRNAYEENDRYRYDDDDDYEDDEDEDDEDDEDDYDDIYGAHNDNTDSFARNDYALNYSDPTTQTSGIDWSWLIVSRLDDAHHGEDITGLIKEAIKDKAHFTPREIIDIASSINDSKTIKLLIEAADENTHFTPIDIMDISYHIDDAKLLKKIIATSEPKFMPENRSLLAPKWQSIDFE